MPPSPSPGGARCGDGAVSSVARNPVERIVPDDVAGGDFAACNPERGPDPGDLDRELARVLVRALNLALGPRRGARADVRFVAHPGARLLHRLHVRFGRAKTVDHHRRGLSRDEVVLPRPGIAVAAAPD